MEDRSSGQAAGMEHSYERFLQVRALDHLEIEVNRALEAGLTLGDLKRFEELATLPRTKSERLTDPLLRALKLRPVSAAECVWPAAGPGGAVSERDVLLIERVSEPGLSADRLTFGSQKNLWRNNGSRYRETGVVLLPDSSLNLVDYLIGDSGRADSGTDLAIRMEGQCTAGSFAATVRSQPNTGRATDFDGRLRVRCMSDTDYGPQYLDFEIHATSELPMKRVEEVLRGYLTLPKYFHHPDTIRESLWECQINALKIEVTDFRLSNLENIRFLDELRSQRIAAEIREGSEAEFEITREDVVAISRHGLPESVPAVIPMLLAHSRIIETTDERRHFYCRP
jgi:hypothetical protein